jgi:hypothetical protein
MACLTSGRVKNCAAAISGGNKFLYLTDTQDIDVVTVGVNEEVTGVTMLLAAVFFKYEFAADTASFTEELTNENCATLVTQQFVMNWRGRNQDDRNQIMEFADCCCGMTAIHCENTGTSWIWGYDETEEIQLLSSSGTTGLLKSDANEEVITLQATATKKARTYTGVIPV